jgi:hypothetical protein
LVSEVPSCAAAARAQDHVGSMKRIVSCPPRPDLDPLLYSLPTFGGGESNNRSVKPGDAGLKLAHPKLTTAPAIEWNSSCGMS